jgi:hypothetical protein
MADWLRLCGSLTLIVAGALGPATHPAYAAAPTAAPTPEAESMNPALTRQALLRSLQSINHKYGPDAVMLEGQLLTWAVRGNSVLETSVSVPGVEIRGGKRFLRFVVETGIVYNDRTVPAHSLPAHLWRDVVEVSLRSFRTLKLPTDGMVLTVGCTHKRYADDADLLEHVSDDHGVPETAVFYLLVSDVGDLIAKRITPQQLLDRSTVLVNGAPTRLVLDLPAAASPTPE